MAVAAATAAAAAAAAQEKLGCCEVARKYFLTFWTFWTFLHVFNIFGRFGCFLTVFDRFWIILNPVFAPVGLASQ